MRILDLPANVWFGGVAFSDGKSSMKENESLYSVLHSNGLDVQKA